MSKNYHTLSNNVSGFACLEQRILEFKKKHGAIPPQTVFELLLKAAKQNSTDIQNLIDYHPGDDNEPAIM
jgi:hypothetical protein